jgi:hypothetical protein
MNMLVYMHLCVDMQGRKHWRESQAGTPLAAAAAAAAEVVSYWGQGCDGDACGAIKKVQDLIDKRLGDAHFQ